MRLLLICGSAEPGKGGVGDYTRQLALAIRATGPEVMLCALMDNHCAAPLQSTIPTPGGALIEIRLPTTLTWTERQHYLRDWVAPWQPTAVSLQYVPYSYNSRGLPFRFASRLKKALPGPVVWHVMFHEIRIGITRRSSWKHRLIGALQGRIVRDLVATLRPAVCHTSNVLYQSILADNGIAAERLPLCSSVPVVATQREWLEAELAQLGIAPAERHRWWIAGMFGSCYPDVPLEHITRNIVADAERLGRRPAMIGFGGGPGTGSGWEMKVRQAAPGIVVRHFGRQATDRISALLSSLDAGLPNTPRQFLGKSASAAAMHAHGVPLDGRYEVDLPEYRDRWQGDVSEADLFWSQTQIVERMLAALSPDNITARRP